MISLLKRNIGFVIVAVVALAIGGFFLLDPHVRRDDVSHYQLTAEFEVNGKPVKVSQVYGYNCAPGVADMRGKGLCTLRGEAMRADLGASGSVFVLMNGWTPDGKELAGHDVLVRNLLTAQVGRQPIASIALPVMVRFRDPSDPKTVEAVDPEHLGDGVRFKAMTVTSSQQATQYGKVAPALPWLAGLKGDRLDRDGEENSLAYRLHGFDFMWAG